MRRVLPWLWALPILLLFGACFSQYERVTIEEETGFRGRAAYDPLYAAELLFAELGLPMERPHSWKELPPVQHTILLPGHSFQSAVPVEPLHAWVRRGGHLVVFGPSGSARRKFIEAEEEEPEAESEEVLDADKDVDFNDPLLEPLGLAFLPASAVITDEEASEALVLSAGRGSRSVRINRRVGVASDIETHLQTPAIDDTEDAEDATYSLVRVAVGKGWVTAVSDTEFLTNPQIGDLDHAAFAWDVVAPPHRIPEGLSVFLRTGVLPWYELLLRFAWMALLSGAIALVIFLWSRGSRFGPISAAEPPDRRSLLEHVAASGEFLWQHRLGEVLLQSSRARFLRDATRNDPFLARLPEKERIRHLAARAGLSGGQLASALEDRGVEDPTEFLHIMTTLESVRRASGGAPPQPPPRR